MGRRLLRSLQSKCVRVDIIQYLGLVFLIYTIALGLTTLRRGFTARAHRLAFAFSFKTSRCGTGGLDTRPNASLARRGLVLGDPKEIN